VRLWLTKSEAKAKNACAILALATCLLTFPLYLLAAEGTSTPPFGGTKTQGASSSSHHFEQILKQAAQAREQNKPEDAVRLYREALKLKPSWLEGWWDLGAILYDFDRYDEARDAFRRLANLKPEGGPGWAMLGLCEFELRDYEQALQHLLRAQTAGVGNNSELNSVAQYHLAVLYTRFEQYEASTKTLFTLARTGNESSSLMEALGLSVLRMSFLPSELPPDKREMVLMAGRAAYDMRTHQAAAGKKEFEELIARYPEAPNVHYAYGTFLLNTDADAALSEFNREIQISPNHVPARLQIAFEDLKRSDFVAGLPFAQGAVELAPQLFAAHDALGRILLGVGDTAGAIRELETAVKLAPDSPEVCFALYTAYARAGKKEDAERTRAEFIRLDKLRKN
jgi:tetratricopeptide (TPR) repeat protein